MSYPQNHQRNVVLVGGGIIGCTTAYFLTRHPAFDPSRHAITLLEGTAIAAGASGKAGGLLAKWAYPSCLASLSFRTHAALAEEHNGQRWGYRLLNCGQLEAQTFGSYGASTKKGQAGALHKRSAEASAKARKAAKGLPDDLNWISHDVRPAYEPMAPEGDTAQVHPALFTKAMAELAEQKGVNIKIGKVLRIERTQEEKGKPSRVERVIYRTTDDSEEHSILADTVILAAGPWTPTVFAPAPISYIRAHSVVIKPPEPVSAYALFTEISLSKHQTVSPEIYARPDETIYACGEGDSLVPLPATAAEVQVDQTRCAAIIDQVASISDELKEGEVLVRQACYLPQTKGARAGPLIGKTHVEGLLIAAGHTCWGIQNAPATGLCMAELVWDDEIKSADLSSLDPRRFIKKSDTVASS